MGIVADMDLADVTFGTPRSDRAGFATGGVFGYEMLSFRIQFGAAFSTDPARGVGGSPKGDENWRLGIVQNVLYARYRFVYAQGKQLKVFEREERVPSVDMVDGSKEFPFYADSSSVNTRPVSRIVYSGAGYREVSSGRVDNSPSQFSMWDQPSGGAPLDLRHEGNSYLLKTVEKVLIFQTWLVAIKKGFFDISHVSPALAAARELVAPDLFRSFAVSSVTLACVPPFSLTFWADMDLANFNRKYSYETPAVKWGVYGEDGNFQKKPINRSIVGLGSLPTVKAQAGDGGRHPIITGTTGNDATRKWLEPLGLYV